MTRAILVIDLQKGIKKMVTLSSDTKPRGFDELVQGANRRIIAQKGAGDEIILVTVTKPLVPEEFSELLLCDEAMTGNYHHSKTTGSAFADGKLFDHLKALGIKEIEVFGVVTSNGVYHTVKDGLSLGLKVSIYADLCADRSQKKHDDALASMARLGATINR